MQEARPRDRNRPNLAMAFDSSICLMISFRQKNRGGIKSIIRRLLSNVLDMAAILCRFYVQMGIDHNISMLFGYLWSSPRWPNAPNFLDLTADDRDVSGSNLIRGAGCPAKPFTLQGKINW